MIAPANALAPIVANDLAPVLELDGPWEFFPDPAGAGAAIMAPGCWEAQGFPKNLDGPVLYRRTFTLPSSWEGLPVVVEFDAVSYAATVRCNGRLVGRHQGLWTPFAVDLSAALQEGLNTLEVEVTKPSHTLTGGAYPMRTTLAGFLPDVATTFGGIWQSARLRVAAWGLASLQVDADLPGRQVRVAGRVHAAAPGASMRAALSVQVEVELAGAAEAHAAAHAVEAAAPGGQFAVVAPLGEVAAWSPDRPALYGVRVSLLADGAVVAAAARRVGFRELRAQGEQLLLNGAPICLRGALSWGWNPAVIAPRCSAESVRAELRTLRAMGFNLVKLCLFVPNQVYYDVADEEGMLIWQEWPLWLPDVTPELRARAPGEYAAYMALTRSHPSVVVYSLGCELDSSVGRELLQALDAVARGAAEGVLFCDNSGSGEAYDGLAEDFADFADYHTYSDLHYLEGVLDHWRRDWLRPRPWLFGEFCDSDGFRDRPKLLAANGGQLPWWLTADNPTCVWRPEMQAVLAYDARMGAAFAHPAALSSPSAPAPEFDLAAIAAAQSLMVRKYTLETVRKRRSVQGYVITGLIDTPIATSGVLDDFGVPKWEPEVFRRCNDNAILCLDTGRSRIWQHGGDRPQRLDVHNWWRGAPVGLHVILNHTEPQPIAGATVTWAVVAEDGSTLADGRWDVAHPLPPSFPQELGRIAFAAPAGDEPQALTLHVACAAPNFHCRNQWPLWLYPRPHFDPAAALLYDPLGTLDAEWQAYAAPVTAVDLNRSGAQAVVIATALDAPLVELLRRGGCVLLLQCGGGPLPSRRLPFWREAIKLLPPHELWRRFPQKGFTDLQFFGLASDVAFDTERLSAALPDLQEWTPILRRLDARQFTMTDYLFNAAVGAGRLLACALRLQGGAGAQPSGLACSVAGQYLLAELLALLRTS